LIAGGWLLILANQQPSTGNQKSVVKTMPAGQAGARLFVLYEAIKRGVSIDELYLATKIDRWFLYGLRKP